MRRAVELVAWLLASALACAALTIGVIVYLDWRQDSVAEADQREQRELQDALRRAAERDATSVLSSSQTLAYHLEIAGPRPGGWAELGPTPTPLPDPIVVELRYHSHERTDRVIGELDDAVDDAGYRLVWTSPQPSPHLVHDPSATVSHRLVATRGANFDEAFARTVETLLDNGWLGDARLYLIDQGVLVEVTR